MNKSSESRYTTAEYVARVVAEAPPLSEEQRARLSRLLAVPDDMTPPLVVTEAADVLAEMRGAEK